MGAPELPNDTGDENLYINAPMQHAHMASDDSDDHETMDIEAINGYQPLATEENGISNNANIYVSNTEEESYENAEITHGDPNLPPIESIESEIERQIWNNPRPQELQQIELDSEKTSQILNAMANFTLPNMQIPEWAKGVPEERWKSDLLQRIRDRKDLPTTSQVAKADNSKLSNN